MIQTSILLRHHHASILQRSLDGSNHARLTMRFKCLLVVMSRKVVKIVYQWIGLIHIDYNTGSGNHHSTKEVQREKAQRAGGRVAYEY